MKWVIFKDVADFVVIEADSFDKALKEARAINQNYNGGFLIKDEESEKRLY